MNYSCFLSKSILLYVYVINLAWCYSFEMEYFILYIIPLSKSNFNFIRITTMQLMTNKIPLKLTLVQNSDKFCIMKLNLHFLAIQLFTSMSYCAIFVKKVYSIWQLYYIWYFYGLLMKCAIENCVLKNLHSSSSYCSTVVEPDQSVWEFGDDLHYLFLSFLQNNE